MIISSISQWEKVTNYVMRRIKPGDSLFLSGDIGSGKTTLTSLLLNKWQVLKPLGSPTFQLIHHYESTFFQILHVDAYRLDNKHFDECQMIQELFTPDSVLILEWPEHIRQNLWIIPTFEVHIFLMNAHQRDVTFYHEGAIVNA